MANDNNNSKEKCSYINGITSYNSFYFDENFKLVLNLESKVPVDFVDKILMKSLSIIFSSLKKKKRVTVCSYTDNFNLYYLGVNILENNIFKGVIFIGPILRESITREQKATFKAKYNLSNVAYTLLSNLYKTLPQCTYEKSEQLKVFLFNAINVNLTKYHSYSITKKFPNPLKKIVQNQVFEHFTFIESNYKTETNVLRLVETGNIAAIKQLLNNSDNINAYIPKRNPHNPLREIKNLTITLNSIIARAAIKGGLPLYIVHSISEKNAILIELLDNVNDTRDFQLKMLIEFSKAVNDYSTKTYSPLIKKAISLIVSSTYKKTTLTQIAKQLYVSQAHLSRKFKKEVNINISIYIHKIKIKEAIHLMETTDKSISRISSELNYSSVAHFSRTFSKITLKTPSAYKKTI